MQLHCPLAILFSPACCVLPYPTVAWNILAQGVKVCVVSFVFSFSHLVTLRVLEMSPAATSVVGKDAQLRAHKVHSSTCTLQAEFKVVLDVCRHSWRGRSRLPPRRRRYCQDVLACLPLSVAPVSHVKSVQLFSSLQVQSARTKIIRIRLDCFVFVFVPHARLLS